MAGPLFISVLPDAGFPGRDYIEIAGLRSPGKCTIMKANSPRGWDERAGYGLTGATLVPSGDKLADIEILFEFWDPNDLGVWKAYARKFFSKSLLTPPGGAVGLALNIDHPVLKFPPLNLGPMVFVDCTCLVNDGYGLWSQTIYLKQFRRAQPQILSKPLTAIPDIDLPQPDANSSLKQKVAADASELAALAGP